MKIKNKISTEYKVFRQEVTWEEYAFWWVVRIIIITVLIKSLLAGDPDKLALRLSAKFASAFILPLFHLLPRKTFLARLSYRVQTLAAVMLLLTAVFGQYKGWYSTIEWYDAYLHIFGCFLCVFAGYYLTMALKHDTKPLTPVVAGIGGFGFSFFFAVGWEIFEFVTDTFIDGGNAQNWMFINSAELLSYFPGIEPQRYALLDTMTDMIFGAAGSLLGGFVLFIYVYAKNKKSD